MGFRPGWHLKISNIVVDGGAIVEFYYGSSLEDMAIESRTEKIEISY